MTLTAVDKSMDSTELNALWAEMAAHIKKEVSADSYDRWFREIEPVELDEKNLTLRVPNNIYQLWIESNFRNLLRSVVLLTLQAPRDLKFVLRDELDDVPPAEDKHSKRHPHRDS